MLETAELRLPDSKLKTPVSRACWFSLLYTKRWVLYAFIAVSTHVIEKGRVA
jgi:hypothetical protein